MRSSYFDRQSPRTNPFNDDRSSSITDDTYDDTTQSEMTSVGSDESGEISFAELGLTEDYFSHPEGHFGLSTVEELEAAIDNCKSMIQSARENSDRQKKLVKKLIELRVKFQEIKEGPEEHEPKTKQVLGHKLKKRKSKSIKHYCDCCNGLIWGVLQSWYRCRECDLNCHLKCLNSIRRKCIASNVDLKYNLDICPEMGLSWQQFNCIECKNPVSIEGVGKEEARICDYTGHYFCPNCHWNDECVSPARVLHGWDFALQKVSRHTVQLLKRLYRRPLLNLEELNPLLFNYVDELCDIRKLRKDILLMKEYFVTCNTAIQQKQLLKLSHRQHFVDNAVMYSMEDLVLLKEGVLLEEITTIVAEFAQHIKLDCVQCQMKGFYCEICGTGETLFAFDTGASMCAHCKAVFHKDCFMFLVCPRCERMKIKKQRKQISTFDDDTPSSSSKSDKDSSHSTKNSDHNSTSDTPSTTLQISIVSKEDQDLSKEVEKTTAAFQKVTVQPYQSASNMLRSRLSLPVLPGDTQYSVSSPEKPDYKHNWDPNQDSPPKRQVSSDRCNAEQVSPEKAIAVKSKKHHFLKTDVYSDKYESNPITRRPQRNDSDFGDLVKVRARSRHKSGKKKDRRSNPVNIDDPFGNLLATKSSKFIKEVSTAPKVAGNSEHINPFENLGTLKSQSRKDQNFNSPSDVFRPDHPKGKKFIDELTDNATSKSGLSKFRTFDPNSVNFLEERLPNQVQLDGEFLSDAFEPSSENNQQYSSRGRSRSKQQPKKSRQPSYDPVLDPFRTDDYDASKNPFH